MFLVPAFRLPGAALSAADIGAQIFHRERVWQAVEYLAAEVAHLTKFLEFPFEQGFLKCRVRSLHGLEAVAGRQAIVILLSASNMPPRKAIEETCPSAVARKLRIKRNEPAGTSN